MRRSAAGVHGMVVATQEQKYLSHKMYVTGQVCHITKLIYGFNAKETGSAIVTFQFFVYPYTHRKGTYTAWHCFDWLIHVTMTIMMIVVSIR